MSYGWAEVGVGTNFAGGGVTLDTSPQATASIARRVKEMAATDPSFRMTSAALLSCLFDPIKVQGHIAPVLFLTAGEDLLRLVWVVLHGVTGGR